MVLLTKFPSLLINLSLAQYLPAIFVCSGRPLPPLSQGLGSVPFPLCSCSPSFSFSDLRRTCSLRPRPSFGPGSTSPALAPPLQSRPPPSPVPRLQTWWPIPALPGAHAPPGSRSVFFSDCFFCEGFEMTLMRRLWKVPSSRPPLCTRRSTSRKCFLLSASEMYRVLAQPNSYGGAGAGRSYPSSPPPGLPHQT